MRSGSGALSTWGTNLTKRYMRSGSGALSTRGTNLKMTCKEPILKPQVKITIENGNTANKTLGVDF